MRINYFVFLGLIVLMSCSSEDEKIPAGIKDLILTEALKDEMQYNMISETQELNRNLSLVNIENRQTVLFKDLVKSDVLFFYFANIHCSECVDNEAKLIQKNYKRNQIILIGKESSLRSLLVFKRLKSLEFDIYYMKPDESFNMKAEELSRPIYFKVNELFKPYSLYEPKFSYPEFSENYHSSMVKILN